MTTRTFERARRVVLLVAGIVLALLSLALAVMTVRGAAAAIAIEQPAIANDQPPFTAYDPQPADKHSNFPLSNGDAIWDREFVYYLTATLGITNCQSMVFVFGQCFGGGILDELIKAGFTCTLSAQSAARYDEFSWGGAAEDAYLHALAQSLVMSPTQPIRTAAGEAAQNDPAGQNHLGKEHPQYTDTGSLTSTVSLSGAHSFHAILFAGNPDGARHWGDLIRMYNLLTATYGYTSGQIQVLYDNGQWPSGNDVNGDPFPSNPGIPIISATRQNLTQTLMQIGQQMSPEEQFFFWSSDHGGSGAIPASTLPGGNSSCSNLTGPCVMTMAVSLEPQDLVQVSTPSLDFQYVLLPQVGEPPTMTVCFNHYCDPQVLVSTEPQRIRLPIPLSALGPENFITFTVEGSLSALFGAEVNNTIVDFGPQTTRLFYSVYLPIIVRSP